jgi:MFS family permease
MYTENKTKMLNRFHVWFPGGIVIGGVLSWLLIDQMHLSWQLLTGLLFIPLALYGFLFFGQAIPETERVSTGVTYKDMLKGVGAPVTIILVIFYLILAASVPGLAINFDSNLSFIVIGIIIVAVIVEGLIINKTNLLFPFILFCMFLTASSELGTNQWINKLLETTGINPMIILVVVTGIMAVGRFFAGPLVHRLNPTGVLLGSAILSVVGLYMLSIADTAGFTFFAAIFFAAGVCYFWPTMLGFVAEYIPKSGALGLSIMGGAGMVATSVVIGIMGKTMEAEGTQKTLQYMTILPSILVAAFIFLVIYMRGKKHVH